jgi:signal transduction histidine kinase
VASDGLDGRALERLLEAGQDLVAELDLETLLDRLLGVARELTGARYAAIGILDGRRKELERFLVSGIDDATQRTTGDLPRGRGILGELIRDPRPLRLDDLSAHPRSYGFPAGHPPMTTFLGVPIVIRGEAWGNLYLTEKETGAFDQRDEKALVVLANWAGVAISNARLYTDMEHQRDDLQRAVRSLKATATIAKAVGGETDLHRMLELIVKRARALVEARTLLIMLVEGDELVLVAGAGEHARPDGGLRIPVAGSAPGAVLKSRRPERVSDVRTRVHLALGDLPADARSALMVPLVFRGRSSGLLIAVDRVFAGPAFSLEDEQLLSAFAASAATAVATGQTVEAERLRETMRAAEDERKRWARELHDETLQGLGALQVMLSSTKRSGASEAQIEQVTGRLGEEIDRLQGLIAQLRPAALDEIGLGAAIENLVERMREVFEIELVVDLDYEEGRAPKRFDGDVESAIYRVVQEALNNARKHANAARVTVAIREADGAVTIEVRDDGSGFDAGAVEGGFGLVGMSERIALVGGRLDVASAPGAGTAIQATVPSRHDATGLRAAAG